MAILHTYRRRARQLLGPILTVGLVVYFVYHAFHGDRGILAWVRLSQELADARTVLTAEQTKQDQLQHRVGLMRPESLDLDLLEERARIMANMVRPGDVVILHDPKGTVE